MKNPNNTLKNLEKLFHAEFPAAKDLTKLGGRTTIKVDLREDERHVFTSSVLNEIQFTHIHVQDMRNSYSDPAKWTVILSNNFYNPGHEVRYIFFPLHLNKETREIFLRSMSDRKSRAHHFTIAGEGIDSFQQAWTLYV